MSGIGEFFKTLASRDGIREQAQAAQISADLGSQYDRARASKALREEAIARDEYNARQGLQEILETNGVAPDQAAILANTMRAGFGNFAQVSDGAGTVMRNAALPQAFAAADRGDTAGMNMRLALYGGKPVDTTKVANGIAYNPLDVPGQRIETTPVGASMIAENNAGAQYDQARAKTEPVRALGAYASAMASAASKGAYAGTDPTVSLPAAASALNVDPNILAPIIAAQTSTPQASGVPATGGAAVAPSQAAQPVSGMSTMDSLRSELAAGLMPAEIAYNWDLPNVRSDAEFDKLQPGDLFFDVDTGQILQKK